MESEVCGEPRLEVVWNELMNLDKIVGGSAEMFWRGARPGYAGKADPEYTFTQDELDELEDQFDEFENDLRRFLTTKGVDIKSLEMQVADPSMHADIQIQQISAVTGIPKRILVGSERGELASSQDTSSWNSYVESRRTEIVEPGIVRPFVDRCVEYGVLPKAVERYSVSWSDLNSISEKDQADIGKVRADAIAAYGNSAMAQDIMPPEAFSQFCLGLDADEIELIAEMRKAEMQEEARMEDEVQRRLAEEKATQLPQPVPGQVPGETIEQPPNQEGEQK